MRDRQGRLLRADGSLAQPDDPPPEPQRVLEYLALENKMWYPDGWVLREQVFEGVETRVRDMASIT